MFPLWNIIFYNNRLFYFTYLWKFIRYKKENRKLPIVLTISNATKTRLIIIIGNLFQDTKTCLVLYILANIVNGFDEGILILISYVYL